MVSIITASYNKEKYIEETILSALAQTHPGFELIIVDDHSTDSTVEKIKGLREKDARIKLIANTTNKGANYCRNIGIKEAKGDYILFLDADDLLAPACLESRVAKAEKYSESNLLVFTMGVFYKTIGDDKRKWVPASLHPLDDFLKHDLPWSIMQPFWKRDFLLQLQGFDESFNRMQDVELHTRALLNPNVNYKLVAESPDCYYRIDEERKNFNPARFMERWIEASLQYCNKFLPLVSETKKKLLLGTLYQTYMQLLLLHKQKQISSQEFKKFEHLLLIHPLINKGAAIKRSFFILFKNYNLMPFRVPGTNRLIKKLILL